MSAIVIAPFLCLPAGAGAPRPTSARGVDTHVRTSLERTALVVEDDDAMASAITCALQDAGWNVASVSTLEAARGVLDVDHPRLLVLDLTLGDEFGTSLLDELAGQPGAPSTIIVSGFRLGALVAARFGVEFVRKPFEMDDFFGAVERAEKDEGPNDPENS